MQPLTTYYTRITGDLDAILSAAELCKGHGEPEWNPTTQDWSVTVIVRTYRLSDAIRFVMDLDEVTVEFDPRRSIIQA